jgi:hypothetical protein
MRRRIHSYEEEDIAWYQRVVACQSASRETDRKN